MSLLFLSVLCASLWLLNLIWKLKCHVRCGIKLHRRQQYCKRKSRNQENKFVRLATDEINIILWKVSLSLSLLLFIYVSYNAVGADCKFFGFLCGRLLFNYASVLCSLFFVCVRFQLHIESAKSHVTLDVFMPFRTRNVYPYDWYFANKIFVLVWKLTLNCCFLHFCHGSYLTSIYLQLNQISMCQMHTNRDNLCVQHFKRNYCFQFYYGIVWNIEFSNINLLYNSLLEVARLTVQIQILLGNTHVVAVWMFLIKLSPFFSNFQTFWMKCRF